MGKEKSALLTELSDILNIDKKIEFKNFESVKNIFTSDSNENRLKNLATSFSKTNYGKEISNAIIRLIKETTFTDIGKFRDRVARLGHTIHKNDILKKASESQTKEIVERLRSIYNYLDNSMTELERTIRDIYDALKEFVQVARKEEYWWNLEDNQLYIMKEEIDLFVQCFIGAIGGKGISHYPDDCRFIEERMEKIVEIIHNGMENQDDDKKLRKSTIDIIGCVSSIISNLKGIMNKFNNNKELEVLLNKVISKYLEPWKKDLETLFKNINENIINESNISKTRSNLEQNSQKMYLVIKKFVQAVREKEYWWEITDDKLNALEKEIDLFFEGWIKDGIKKDIHCDFINNLDDLLTSVKYIVKKIRENKDYDDKERLRKYTLDVANHVKFTKIRIKSIIKEFGDNKGLLNEVISKYLKPWENDLKTSSKNMNKTIATELSILEKSLVELADILNANKELEFKDFESVKQLFTSGSNKNRLKNIATSLSTTANCKEISKAIASLINETTFADIGKCRDRVMKLYTVIRDNDIGRSYLDSKTSKKIEKRLEYVFEYLHDSMTELEQNNRAIYSAIKEFVKSARSENYDNIDLYIKTFEFGAYGQSDNEEELPYKPADELYKCFADPAQKIIDILDEIKEENNKDKRHKYINDIAENVRNMIDGLNKIKAKSGVNKGLQELLGKAISKYLEPWEKDLKTKLKG